MTKDQIATAMICHFLPCARVDERVEYRRSASGRDLEPGGTVET